MVMMIMQHPAQLFGCFHAPGSIACSRAQAARSWMWSCPGDRLPAVHQCDGLVTSYLAAGAHTTAEAAPPPKPGRQLGH